MTNEEKLKYRIMEDMDFRMACHAFGGVSWEKFDLCNKEEYEPNTIILDTPDKDVYVFMDENYNPIGVHRFKKFDEERSFYDAVYDCRSIYNYTSLFYNYRISDIVELSKRIVISESNHGHSARMFVNGQLVNNDYGKIYIGLLAYIKFLGDKIEEYFKNLYKATILGFEYPTITQYLTSTINCIDKCIDKCISDNERPFPVNILASIGENNDEIDYYNMALYQSIEFLLYEKGYQIGHGENYMKLEPIAETRENIYKKSEEILKLLDTPMEEVKERFRRASKEFIFEEVNLEEELSSDSKKL